MLSKREVIQFQKHFFLVLRNTEMIHGFGIMIHASEIEKGQITFRDVI